MFIWICEFLIFVFKIKSKFWVNVNMIVKYLVICWVLIFLVLFCFCYFFIEGIIVCNNCIVIDVVI